MKHGKLLALLAVVALLSGCAEEPQGGNGQLRVDLSTSPELNVVATRAVENLPDAVILPAPAGFAMVINGAGDFVQNFESIPAELVVLEKGSYSATATCGDPNTEGFDVPAFGVTVPFEIEWNKTTRVDMTAKLTNMAVSVGYTKEFKAYFSDYSVEVIRSAATVLAFAKDETRLAFLKPQAFMVKVNYTRSSNGKTGSMEFDVASNTVACTYHKITLNVNEGAVGGAAFEFKWDDEVETVALEAIDVTP